MALKILLLTHKFYPSIGGIETITQLLAQAFSEVGHEVHVVTWSTDHTNKHFPFTVVRNPNVKHLFREHAWADVVLENNICLRLSWPSIMYFRPSFIVLQTWLPEGSEGIQITKRVKSYWLRRATQVIAISDAVRNRDWPAATVIGNSYDAKIFRIIPAIPRNLDFVFIGRLVSDKGADIAINALQLLWADTVAQKSRVEPYSLTIIGDGPDRDSLEQLVAKLSLQDYVHFTGVLRGQELVEKLNQHRFLLVPSLWEEPFGIVALEGMACGCLPIVSDGGGLPEAVGNAGLTFHRGDAISLATCLRELLDSPEMEQNVRSAAEHQLAIYHPKSMINSYLTIISQV